METVSIRNLRGESLREHADKGNLLGITNRGGLIGVAIPVASAWLEHLIDYNLSHVQQSIVEAEQAVASGAPMVTLQDVVGELQAMLNPGAERPDTPQHPTAVTVRMGDLTAGVIEKAGISGQTVAVTHDRKLIAIVIPVTRDLVEFLLEQNMSRVLYNIGLAEKQMGTAEPMTSLDSLDAGHEYAPEPNR